MDFADQHWHEAGTDEAFRLIVAEEVSSLPASQEAEVVGRNGNDLTAMVLTTTALDALDAVAEPDAAQAEIPVAADEPLAQQAEEMTLVEAAPAEDEAPAAQPDELPQPTEDAATMDDFAFDADLLEIFALYDGFVPTITEDGIIVIAPPPPPSDGGLFLQVISLGPDGQWYTDSSLTTPYLDDNQFLTGGFCPVMCWDGSQYLPEPGMDVLLG